MSSEEKIGQVFMIAGYIDPEFARKEINNPKIIQQIDSYITDYHLGGVAFVGPSEINPQIALTNHYQTLSKIPLLIAQDHEWGLAMRIKNTPCFPKNSTLGALQEDTLVYEMGKEIAREEKLIGVHMNLSPVLDVNINPQNIVINVRSFGDSPVNVASKGCAMIRGLQEGGIIASAKHFPGIGDITTDPHLGLPFSPHSKERFEKIEFHPFREAIQSGILSIQTEHLVAPALESNPKTPSSLSREVVTDLLKTKLGFKGMVLSGALRMQALTDHFTDEEIILGAFKAGSDMLLMPQDFPKAFRILNTALKDGVIQESDLDEKVLKVLKLKEHVRLHEKKLVNEIDLDASKANEIIESIFQKVVKVEREIPGLLPLASTDKIAYIQLGESKNSLKPSNDGYFFSLNENNKDEEIRLISKLEEYTKILVSIYPADPRRIVEIRLQNKESQESELATFKVHGMTQNLIHQLDLLTKVKEKCIVVYYGSPFGKHFLDDFPTFIMAYEDSASKLTL